LAEKMIEKYNLMKVLYQEVLDAVSWKSFCKNQRRVLQVIWHFPATHFQKNLVNRLKKSLLI